MTCTFKSCQANHCELMFFSGLVTSSHLVLEYLLYMFMQTNSDQTCYMFMLNLTIDSCLCILKKSKKVLVLSSKLREM